MLKAFEAGSPSSQVLELAKGESATLVGVSSRGSAQSPAALNVTVDGRGFAINLFDGTATARLTIPGPAELYFVRGSAVAAFATVEVTRAPELTAAIPTAAVVIPEDAEGEFEVLLESTTDGEKWTLAQPGTYGGSTQKRFFRARIVKVK